MKGLRIAGGALALLLLGTLLVWRNREATPAPPPSAPPVAALPTDAAPPAAADPGPVTSSAAPRTTIAVLRVAQGGVQLVSWVTKPLAFDLPAAADAGATRYVLEDARTGAVLASGPCAMPRLCACDGVGEHGRGCVRRKHEAVVRLKLPRFGPSERLTLVGPDGPIARFDLEGA